MVLRPRIRYYRQDLGRGWARPSGWDHLESRTPACCGAEPINQPFSWLRLIVGHGSRNHPSGLIKRRRRSERHGERGARSGRSAQWKGLVEDRPTAAPSRRRSSKLGSFGRDFDPRRPRTTLVNTLRLRDLPTRSSRGEIGFVRPIFRGERRSLIAGDPRLDGEPHPGGGPKVSRAFAPYLIMPHKSRCRTKNRPSRAIISSCVVVAAGSIVADRPRKGSFHTARHRYQVEHASLD